MVLMTFRGSSPSYALSDTAPHLCVMIHSPKYDVPVLSLQLLSKGIGVKHFFFAKIPNSRKFQIRS
jgi:hypothetical protein